MTMGHGADGAESGLEALPNRNRRGTIEPEVSIPPFDPLSGFDSALGHGTVGGAGFRETAIRFIVQITDAWNPMVNGKTTIQGSPRRVRSNLRSTDIGARVGSVVTTSGQQKHTHKRRKSLLRQAQAFTQALLAHPENGRTTAGRVLYGEEEWAIRQPMRPALSFKQLTTTGSTVQAAVKPLEHYAFRTLHMEAEDDGTTVFVDERGFFECLAISPFR